MPQNYVMTSLPTNAAAPELPSVSADNQTFGERLRGFGRPPRIVGLDIARGLAVIGMIAAHTVETYGQLLWHDASTWSSIVNGRPSILFALLAGISIALMTGRSEGPDRSRLGLVRMQLVGRGIVIFAIGLVLEMLGTNIAVILTFYGAIYVIATLFVAARVRTLLLWAVGLAVAGPALQAGLSVLLMGGSGQGTQFLTEGTYSVTVWTSLMLTGLALGRLDVTRKKVAGSALAIGVALSAIGYSLGVLWGGGEPSFGSDVEPYSGSSSIVSSYSYAPAETVPAEDLDLTGLVCEDYGDGYLSCYPDDYFDDTIWSSSSMGDGDINGWDGYAAMVESGDPVGAMWMAFTSAWPHSGGTMEVLGSGGFALAVVGLLVLVGRWLRYALLPIAAVGMMPLTAYTAHVVVIWLLSGPGGWNSDPALFWWLAGGVLACCTAWALLVGRGPLERLTGYVSRGLAAVTPGAIAAGPTETPR